MSMNDENSNDATIPRRSRVFCSVFGCSSRACMADISFHCFPHKSKEIYTENGFGKVEKVKLRNKWIYAIKMGKPVTPSMRVCSKHFKDEDYFVTG